MSSTDALHSPDPASFPELPPEKLAIWGAPGPFDRAPYAKLLGFHLDEARVDYARLRLPYRPELDQPAGVVHGGAIASLIDTVVVPAIASPFEGVPQMLTLSMSIQYLGAVVKEDVVAEGWVTRRGNSIVFCSVAVRTASGAPVASGQLVYKVRPTPT